MAESNSRKLVFPLFHWAVLLFFLCWVTAVHVVLMATFKISLPKVGESVLQESQIFVDWIDLKASQHVAEINQDKSLVSKMTESTKSAEKNSIKPSAVQKISRATSTEHPKQQKILQSAVKNALPRAKSLSTPLSMEKNVETVTKSAILKAKGAESKIGLNLDTLQKQIAQLGTEIRLNQQSAETSRIRFANQVSGHKFIVDQYVTDWQKKVERTGNQNYPKAAVKKNFSAHLTLDVGINIDGSIYSIRINQSSGIPALDEAAKQIVKMSAPFPPLPLELSKELSVLVISKTWSFTDQSGMTAR